ncbi:MAG: hypothetical protein J6Y52_01520 [Bacteroidales bacterium]|nr:hypothetical protein [Bacteroidales bacterium]
MKTTFKFVAIALAAMSLTVACKNAPEAVEDTTPIDTTPIEEIVEDTMPMIDTVEVAPAEPVKKATPKKKAPAKEAVTKTTTKDGKTIMTINTDNTKMEIKADGKAAVEATAPVKKR